MCRSAAMHRKSIPRILWLLPKLTHARGLGIKVSNIWLRKHNGHYDNKEPRGSLLLLQIEKRLIMIIGEIKMLCLGTLHPPPRPPPGTPAIPHHPPGLRAWERVSSRCLGQRFLLPTLINVARATEDESNEKLHSIRVLNIYQL